VVVGLAAMAPLLLLDWALLTACAAVGFFVLLVRIWLALPRRDAPALRVPKEKRVRCLVVLGSGGHTAEMFYDLASLERWSDGFAATYLVANTDRGSKEKAESFEQERGNSQAEIVWVPRAREVGQSYVSSIWTTLKAAWASLWIVLWLMPDVVLCNGPGTCVPVVASAYIARVLGLKRIAVVYSESFACVEHLSLSGRILYPLADSFTVQWPQLKAEHPAAVYAGRLEASADGLGISGDGLPPLGPTSGLQNEEAPATAWVTVGSTKFDDLIQAVDCREVQQRLHSLGIQDLRVQRGRGSYVPSAITERGTEPVTTVLEFVPDLPNQLRRASLVISHAGAGTILDCLAAGRRLVVVPNERLMANHQVQLGMALQKAGLLYCLKCGELADGLQRLDFGSLRRFPTATSPAFGRCLQRVLGRSE